MDPVPIFPAQKRDQEKCVFTPLMPKLRSGTCKDRLFNKAHLSHMFKDVPARPGLPFG